ncbi:MAG: M28 family peptidase [Anaerolineae bacterium]|nr:M28 family peptidase [Anaerolineae bacterium]
MQRHNSALLASAIVVLLAIGVGVYWERSSASLLFDGDRALLHVERQMSFGPRPTGSEASRMTGDYIVETLSASGWSVDRQYFDYRGVEAQNLIGRSEAVEKPIFLIGAHYDTRRKADRDRVSPDSPVPGANDGASGVAVLLELARVLDVSKVNGNVWLVFFDAEDNGQLDDWDWIVGSRYFAEHLEEPIVYTIIVDMIGDSDQNIYYELNSDAALREALWSVARDLGFEDYFIPEVRYSILDDHTPFLEKGFPSVDIIDFDYPFWHTVDDTIDKVSSDSLRRVGRVLEVFLESGGDYLPGDMDR